MLKPENFYLLRTPYLPVSCAEKLIDNPEQTREILTELFNKEELKQALFLASPVLFNELDAYLQHDSRRLNIKKVEQSLVKYIIRASCRSTPYGMFSGISLGAIQDHTSIILNTNNNHTAITRLDMQLLETIVQKIVLIPDLKCQLKLYPNSSAYVINEKLNYFESRMIGRTKAFNHSSVDYTEHIHNILELAKWGATKEQLRTCFDLSEFHLKDVDLFIDEIIDNEILIHNLAPSLTCDNAIDDLIGKIENLNNPVTSIIHIVLDALLRIKNITERTIEIQAKKAAIETELESSFGISNYDADFFQVDLKLEKIKNQIGQGVVDEITGQAEELASIMPASVVEDLENFKIKYSNRYENREMPLTDVLDLEYGIGYGDLTNHTVGAPALIGGITNFKSTSSSLRLRLDALQNLQHKKLYDALKKDFFEIKITEQDVKSLQQLNVQSPTLPDSCYIMGSLLGDNSSEADAGHYKFKLDYFNGPSAATLFARFCHTDSEMINHLKVAIKKEEIHKDAIYAEVVHSSQPRLGNIIHRPVLREYEIPYLSESGNNRAKCIYVSDLMVSISNGEVILRSKRLNRRIIPCLSSAQNFRFASLPIYKFLCDLQHQGIMSSLVWNWGAFQTAKFLPRVVYKKIIISPAIWNIDMEMLKTYDNVEQSPNLHAALASFRSEFKVPDKVLLTDGDNKLLIDLDNEICLEILFKHLKSNKLITITESFFSSANCLVKDSEGNGYAHEIIIPISKTSSEKNKARVSPLQQSEDIKRKFCVGSEWFYAKIYSGHITLDAVLKTNIPNLLKILEEKQMIDKWFFIRYNDPDNHIRLRLHLRNENFTGEVIRLLNDALYDELSNNTIYKIQYDSYERELERYGSAMMTRCETIFWKDSETIINVMNKEINHDFDQNSRWRFAMQSMHEYFNYFKVKMIDRIHFTGKLSDSFCKEFGDTKILNQNLNNLYREKRSLIDNHFDKENNEFKLFAELLHKREKDLIKVVEEMNTYYSQQNTPGIQIPILPSLLHMSINRLFPVYQRKYEMIMYYFLNKQYKKTFYTNQTHRL